VGGNITQSKTSHPVPIGARGAERKDHGTMKHNHHRLK
jgi:hypothetical protein